MILLSIEKDKNLIANKHSEKLKSKSEKRFKENNIA